MKIVREQAKGKVQVRLAPLLEARYAQTRITLLHELRRAMSDLPVTTPEAIALSIILRGLDGTVSISARCAAVAAGYQRINETILQAASHDRQRLASDVEGGQIPAMTIVHNAGLADVLIQKVLTAEDVVEILRIAIYGSGFEQTQERVVAAILRLANTEVPALTRLRAGSLATLVPDIIEISMAVRLMEMARTMLAHPAKAPTKVQIPKPEAAIALRADGARRTGAAVAFTVLAANAQIRRHVARLIMHPWILSQATGKLAASMVQAIREYESREIDYPAFERWAEFDTDGLFDIRMTPHWPGAVPAPTRELTLQSPAWGDPLAGDFSIRVEIQPEMLSHLTDVFWDLVAKTTSAANRWRAIAGGEQSAVAKFTVIPLTANDFSSAPATVPRVSTSVPVITDQLPRAAWYSDTKNWRLLAHPMRSYDAYTYVAALDRIRTTPGVSGIPVVVTGDNSIIGMRSLPTILPYFEVFDAPALRTPMTKDSLATLWQLVPEELEQHLKTLTGGPSTTNTRLLAEALRYIGVLTIRPASSRDDERGMVVYPIVQTWYNTSFWDKFAADQPIKLASRLNVRVGEQTTEVDFLLWPFSHVPTSAYINAITNGSLSVVPFTEQVASKPITTYDVPADRVMPVVPILGWKLSAEEVADIVLVRSLPDPMLPMPITVDSAATDHPQRAAAYNAVIYIDDDTPASTTGNTLPLPVRYENTNSEDTTIVQDQAIAPALP